MNDRSGTGSGERVERLGRVRFSKPHAASRLSLKHNQRAGSSEEGKRHDHAHLRIRMRIPVVEHSLDQTEGVAGRLTLVPEVACVHLL